MKLHTHFRTANAALELECSELISPNAVTLAATPEDGWYLICPYGEFPRPNGDGVQIFQREQADEVVRTFNSMGGLAGRFFKNMWHGLGRKSTVPAFEGHADADPKRWRTMNVLAEASEVKADADGLWGRISWNAANLAARTQERGPLKPSPIFWHQPPDAQGRVFPALLESIGLVQHPNIRTAPQWTANAASTLDGSPSAETTNKTTDPMNEAQLKELRLSLGLPETADAAACITAARTANAAAQQLTERESTLQTANSAKATLETQLSTANASVGTLTTERDGLRTANAALTTEVETLRKGVLDLAEKRGALTPAERPAYEAKLSTANSQAPTLTELQTRKALNTTSVEINGNRIDVTTANARQSALTIAVEGRMKADSCDYDTAYGRVKSDPSFAGLFAAMQDPTKQP
jgi:hypothetical protein